MSEKMGDLKNSALAVVILSATVLTGLAVVTGFKNTGLVDNTTADLFITGLGIFASFIGIVVLAILGKVVINLFRQK